MIGEIKLAEGTIVLCTVVIAVATVAIAVATAVYVCYSKKLWMATRTSIKLAGESAELDREANELSAVTAIHARLTKETSYALRGYIRAGFLNDLNAIVDGLLWFRMACPSST